MTDIIIYTTSAKLMHKKGKMKDDPDFSPEGIYYWKLSRLPKDTKEGEKVYFATNGKIKGYFIIEEINKEEGIVFDSATWNDIRPIYTCKHVQGFKYFKEKK